MKGLGRPVGEPGAPPFCLDTRRAGTTGRAAMPEKPNRRRMPRAAKGTKHPKKKHAVTPDTRARVGRVVSRRSPKCTQVDWGPSYLKVFAECGVMRDAAAAAGVDPHTIWARRQRDPAFAAAEADARAKAADLLESIAWDRATNGLPGRLKFQDGVAVLDPRVPQTPENPVFYQEREYDNTLLITLLKAHKPERYRDKLDVSGKIEHVPLASLREKLAEVRARRGGDKAE